MIEGNSVHADVLLLLTYAAVLSPELSLVRMPTDMSPLARGGTTAVN